MATEQYTYPQLTLQQLQSLSNFEYNQRVVDFLTYHNIEQGKSALISGATTSFDPLCGLFCYINPNFLVYKFLSGIRIVNVGSANGVIQYKAYPDGDDESLYNWQDNGTYLNLDQNGMYIVKVRDYISESNTAACEVEKIISMPLLMASTTVGTPQRTIRLEEATSNTIGDYRWRTGNIITSPTLLTAGQQVKINYTANAIVFPNSINNGTSCVIFKKVNNGVIVPNTTCTITNVNSTSPKTGSFTLSAGDVMCYEVLSNALTQGSTVCANFCLTSVDGLGTIVPSIDTTRCSASVAPSLAQTNVTVSLSGAYPYGQSQPIGVGNLSVDGETCTISGQIYITPDIPSGQCVDIVLSAVTQSVGGVSNVCFTRKSTSVPVDTCICSVCNLQTQPQLPVITARNGDVMCYWITMTAPNTGDNSSVKLCINDANGSQGINALVNGAGNCIIRNISNSATPIMLSICHQNTTANVVNGFINPSVPIPVGQCIETYYSYDTISVGTSNMACFGVYCKPKGGASYVPVYTVTTQDTTKGGNNTVILRNGDTICYCLYAYGKWSCSAITLDNIFYASNGISASNNTVLSKCHDEKYLTV